VGPLNNIDLGLVCNNQMLKLASLPSDAYRHPQGFALS
jgi:hypothetical protein